MLYYGTPSFTRVAHRHDVIDRIACAWRCSFLLLVCVTPRTGSLMGIMNDTAWTDFCVTGLTSSFVRFLFLVRFDVMTLE